MKPGAQQIAGEPYDGLASLPGGVVMPLGASLLQKPELPPMSHLGRAVNPLDWSETLPFVLLLEMTFSITGGKENM